MKLCIYTANFITHIFQICEVTHSLKLIWNSQVSSYSASMIIHGGVQSSE